MHIVRNSLDHGIEAPEQRVAAGKPEQGRISFTCVEHEGGKQLRIHDDGRGLALHKLYEKGVANGVFSNAEKPTPAEVAELIFQSGLSTASQSDSGPPAAGWEWMLSVPFCRSRAAVVSIELDNPGGEFGFTPFTFVIKFASIGI
jgi:two-component system chemotaxis sensor kinase CheA